MMKRELLMITDFFVFIIPFRKKITKLEKINQGKICLTHVGFLCKFFQFYIIDGKYDHIVYAFNE